MLVTFPSAKESQSKTAQRMESDVIYHQQSLQGSEIRRHALNLRQMPESGKGLGYKSQPSDRVESVWVVMLRVGNYCCLQIPWGIVSIQTTSESRLSSSPAIFGSICH